MHGVPHGHPATVCCVRRGHGSEIEISRRFLLCNSTGEIQSVYECVCVCVWGGGGSVSYYFSSFTHPFVCSSLID